LAEIDGTLIRTKAWLGRAASWVGRGALAAILALWAGAPVQARYAAYVIDVDTGAILHQTNAGTLNYPASLTKIMTLYLVFEALDRGERHLTDMLPVSRHAAGRPPSKLRFKPGDEIMLNDAILALTTKSANDVATVIAEWLGGTEAGFAERMTARARELGMTDTTFRNASGLPDRRQRTTARDLSVLARAIYTDFPHFAHYFSIRSFSYRGRTYRNHNNLLGRVSGVDGIKTGYTNASGYNLAASARRDGHHVIAVVMGGRTARRRDNQMRRLLDRAFVTVARNEVLFAAVSRPRHKPDPDDPRPLAADPPDRLGAGFGRATAAVGEALSSYIAIPRARAASGAETSPPEERAWGVQVGAFSREPAAARTLDHTLEILPDLLAGTQRRIIAVSDEHGTLYRARQVGLSEDQARRVCARLHQRDLPCLISPPDPSS
jgi:D-alanyl-D-alanine carboxypeptidase